MVTFEREYKVARGEGAFQNSSYLLCLISAQKEGERDALISQLCFSIRIVGSKVKILGF